MIFASEYCAFICFLFYFNGNMTNCSLEKLCLVCRKYMILKRVPGGVLGVCTRFCFLEWLLNSILLFHFVAVDVHFSLRSIRLLQSKLGVWLYHEQNIAAIILCRSKLQRTCFKVACFPLSFPFHPNPTH